MQSTQLPREMVEGMGLRFVCCGIKSTPPHFVVNVMNIIELSVLTLTLLETRLFTRGGGGGLRGS